MRTTCVAACLALQLCPNLFAEDPPQHLGHVTSIVRSGDTLFSISQAGVLRQDRQLKRTRRVYQASCRVFDLALATSDKDADKHLLLAGGDPSRSGEIFLLDLRGQLLAQSTLSKDVVYEIAVSPDGKFAAAACADGAVVLVALPSLRRLRTLHRHTSAARTVAFDASGQLVISGGLDGVLILTAMSNSNANSRSLVDHTAAVESLTVVENGTIYSGSRDGKVRVHTKEGRLLRTYGPFFASVWSLCLGPEGKVFAGLSDGSILQLQKTTRQTQPLKQKLRGGVRELIRDEAGLFAGTLGKVVRVGLR